MSGHGIGAKWAIRQALAAMVRQAAENLESAELIDGERQYNAAIEWPQLYTFRPEEGPAALRAVADELVTSAEDRLAVPVVKADFGVGYGHRIDFELECGHIVGLSTEDFSRFELPGSLVCPVCIAAEEASK